MVSAEAGWRRGDLSAALDQAPTLGHAEQAGCRVLSGSATQTGSGSGSERDGGRAEPRNYSLLVEAACYITSSVSFPSQPSTYLLLEQMSTDRQVWLRPFGIFLPLSGQVPTRCRAGKRDSESILQMQ